MLPAGKCVLASAWRAALWRCVLPVDMPVDMFGLVAECCFCLVWRQVWSCCLGRWCEACCLLVGLVDMLGVLASRVRVLRGLLLVFRESSRKCVLLASTMW